MIKYLIILILNFFKNRKSYLNIFKFYFKSLILNYLNYFDSQIIWVDLWISWKKNWYIDCFYKNYILYFIILIYYINVLIYHINVLIYHINVLIKELICFKNQFKNIFFKLITKLLNILKFILKFILKLIWNILRYFILFLLIKYRKIKININKRRLIWLNSFYKELDIDLNRIEIFIKKLENKYYIYIIDLKYKIFESYIITIVLTFLRIRKTFSFENIIYNLKWKLFWYSKRIRFWWYKQNKKFIRNRVIIILMILFKLKVRNYKNEFEFKLNKKSLKLKKINLIFLIKKLFIITKFNKILNIYFLKKTKFLYDFNLYVKWKNYKSIAIKTIILFLLNYYLIKINNTVGKIIINKFYIIFFCFMHWLIYFLNIINNWLYKKINNVRDNIILKKKTLENQKNLIVMIMKIINFNKPFFKFYLYYISILYLTKLNKLLMVLLDIIENKINFINDLIDIKLEPIRFEIQCFYELFTYTCHFIDFKLDLMRLYEFKYDVFEFIDNIWFLKYYWYNFYNKKIINLMFNKLKLLYLNFLEETFNFITFFPYIYNLKELRVIIVSIWVIIIVVLLHYLIYLKFYIYPYHFEKSLLRPWEYKPTNYLHEVKFEIYYNLFETFKN